MIQLLADDCNTFLLCERSIGSSFIDFNQVLSNAGTFNKIHEAQPAKSSSFKVPHLLQAKDFAPNKCRNISPFQNPCSWGLSFDLLGMVGSSWTHWKSFNIIIYKNRKTKQNALNLNYTRIVLFL